MIHETKTNKQLLEVVINDICRTIRFNVSDEEMIRIVFDSMPCEISIVEIWCR